MQNLEKYKTDKAIESEFHDFIITEIVHDHTGSTGARSGYITIVWPCGGDHVGGGIENGDVTTDHWIDYDGDGCKIAFDSWYPENVGYKLRNAIRAHLFVKSIL